MNWLVKATRGDELPEEKFDLLCEALVATDKLITKDQLYAMFEARGEDSTEAIEDFHEKVAGALQTKVWFQISMEKCKTENREFPFAPEVIMRTRMDARTGKRTGSFWKRPTYQIHSHGNLLP